MTNLDFKRLAHVDAAFAHGSRLVALLMAFLLSFQGVVEAEAAQGEPLVIVTIKPVHALVSQVMAGIGEPYLLVDGASSPHSFSLRPSQSSAVSKADVFVRVSPHVEPFTTRLQAILPADSVVLTLADAEGVRLLSRRDGANFDHDHDHEHSGDDHHDDATDGHIWLDTKNARAVVRSVAKALSERYPTHSKVFDANVQKTLAKIEALEKRIAGRLKSVPAPSFVVFHDAYQYFEVAFGLHAIGSIVVDPQISPSGARLSEIRKVIKSRNVKCVFGEPQTSPAIVSAVTEGLDVEYGELDAVGTTITAGPDAYEQLMDALSDRLLSCLTPSE